MLKRKFQGGSGTSGHASEVATLTGQLVSERRAEVAGEKRRLENARVSAVRKRRR